MQYAIFLCIIFIRDEATIRPIVCRSVCPSAPEALPAPSFSCKFTDWLCLPTDCVCWLMAFADSFTDPTYEPFMFPIKSNASVLVKYHLVNAISCVIVILWFALKSCTSLQLWVIDKNFSSCFFQWCCYAVAVCQVAIYWRVVIRKKTDDRNHHSWWTTRIHHVKWNLEIEKIS